MTTDHQAVGARPRAGIDSSGTPRVLGDRDSDGIVVGYIDAGGLCWRDRLERDSAVLAGMLDDARRTPGETVTLAELIGRAGVAAEHRRACAADALARVRALERMRRLAAGR